MVAHPECCFVPKAAIMNYWASEKYSQVESHRFVLSVPKCPYAAFAAAATAFAAAALLPLCCRFAAALLLCILLCCIAAVAAASLMRLLLLLASLRSLVCFSFPPLACLPACLFADSFGSRCAYGKCSFQRTCLLFLCFFKSKRAVPCKRRSAMTFPRLSRGAVPLGLAALGRSAMALCSGCNCYSRKDPQVACSRMELNANMKLCDPAVTPSHRFLRHL